MKKPILWLLSLLLILSLCACGSQPQSEDATTVPVEDGPFQVGFGRTLITPEGSLPMSASNSSGTRLSTQTLDDLYATCIAFTDGRGQTLLLFQMDLKYADGYADLARGQISQELGIPLENIMISATHTPYAPDTGYYQDEQYPQITEYVDHVLLPRTLEAARLAMDDRKTTQLSGASITLEGLNFIRHYVLTNGTAGGEHFGELDSNTATEHMSEPDEELQLLQFTREGGKSIVLMNWQTHPTRSGSSHTAFTSDIVGVARTYMESELDCHFAYFTGASSDVDPHSLIPSENITSDYTEQGREIAKHGIMALENSTPLALGHVQVQTREGHAETRSMDISAFSIGQVGFVVAPYEMFSENGQYIKQNSPFETTFVVTCANGQFGYFPSEETYNYKSYEYLANKIPQGNAEEMAQLYVQMLGSLYAERTLGQIEPGTPVTTDGLLYWNLDRQSQHTANIDGTYTVRMLCNGKMLDLRAREELLPQIDAADIMGLTLEGNEIVTVHSLSQLPVCRMADGYFVQSLEEQLLTLNSHGAMLGKQLEFTLSDTVQLWSITKEAPLSRPLQEGDLVTAVCDSEGNPLELFVTEMAIDLTLLETSSRYCVHCSEKATFYHWNLTDRLPVSEGHYLLTEEVNLTDTTRLYNGEVCLDLNGHNIKQRTHARRIFDLAGMATLTICDSRGDGTIRGASSDAGGPTGGMIVRCISANATFKLYSGILDASKVTCESACAVDMQSGKMYMHGGTIKGGTTYGVGAPCVSIDDSAELTMYGGVMIGGQVQKTEYTSAEFPNAGGAVMRIRGTVTVQDGLFIGGNSEGNGGALYVCPGATLKLMGGTISGGKCRGNGAGIYLDGACTLALSRTVILSQNEGSNLYIGAKASVSASSLDGARIGITAEKPGLFLAGSFSTSEASCFSSDDPAYKVEKTEEGLVLTPVS